MARSRGLNLALSALSVGAIVLITVGLSLIGHHLATESRPSAFSYVFAVGSIAAFGIALCWSGRWRWPATLAIVAAAAALVRWLLDEQVDARWLYLLQHAGMMTALGLLFGLSLRPGRRSLITTLALRVHGELPPGLLRYTRQVNWAWTLFFATMLTLSLLLWWLGPPGWWSVLANFLTLPAVALMFIGEYLIRLWRFPDFPHASLMDGVRAFSRRA